MSADTLTPRTDALAGTFYLAKSEVCQGCGIKHDRVKCITVGDCARIETELNEAHAHMGQSDKELCQLQDALGCPAESRKYYCSCGWKGYNKHTCPKCNLETHDDGMADSQELSMERIRDLIAAEGELGDLRTCAEKLAGAYDKYTALLIEELNDVVDLAAAHGWKSSQYEAGEQCRKEIAELKANLPK